MKTNRIIFFILCAALSLTLCSCAVACQTYHHKPENQLSISETDIESTGDFDLFAGCSINAVRMVQNNSGETQYISRYGEPFVYDGKAIRTTLSISSYSSFPAKAKVFVMIDGILCPIISNNGQSIQSQEYDFDPVDYGEFIYESTINIPICFEPVFPEAKDSYDLAFCIYIYDHERRTDDENIPHSQMNARVSFCTISYELIIKDGTKIIPQKSTVIKEPDKWCRFKNTDELDNTESIIKLSASADPKVYNNGHCKLSPTDDLYLYIYFNTTDRYQTMLFVDGEYYNAFGNTGILRFNARGEEPSVSCTSVDFSSLSSGSHSADIITYNLTTKTAESHSSFFLHID